MIRPWNRIRTQREHDYKILKVREDIVVDPRNQVEHPRVVIESPDWVNVVAITDAQQVILVKQFRTGISQISLEVPGGIIEPGETPIAAAARELEEETGYRSEKILPMGYCHPNPAIQNNRCYFFLAHQCVKVSGGHLDEGEDIEIELHSRGTALQLILAGQITHALAVNALLLYGLS